MAQKLSFYRWLMWNVTRQDRIGDLARDVEADPRFPQHATQLNELRMYMQHASIAALECLSIAWLEWRDGLPPEPLSRMSWLTEQELRAIAQSWFRRRSATGGNKQELDELRSWATSVRRQSIALQLILDGKLDIDLGDFGEIEFFPREK